MKLLAVLMALVGGFAATACTSSKRQLMFLTPDQWELEVRRRGVDPAEVANPLAITANMHQTAETLAGPGTHQERMRHLQQALFDEHSFPFRYQNRETLTAAEAFHRREGNCLSFTNLFVALGRSLGARVTTALVRRARAAEREGDLIVINNHVVAAMDWTSEAKYFDFDLSRHDPPIAFQPLDDLAISALYLNNRGADELRAGRPDIAIRYFDNTVKLAPDFAPGWGNIGVTRRRLGDIDGALAAYQKALEIEPANPTILSNLGALYRAIGRDHEADTIVAAIRVRGASPHVVVIRGDLARTKGDIPEAIRLYKRARRLAPNYPEALIGLARAELARSRRNKALTYLEKALILDPGNREAAGMLARLRGTTSRDGV